MTKVESKKTGDFRRNNPVVQPEFSDNEQLIKALASEKCNKCNGTGRRGFQVFGFGGVNEYKYIMICKCVPTSLIDGNSSHLLMLPV